MQQQPWWQESVALATELHTQPSTPPLGVTSSSDPSTAVSSAAVLASRIRHLLGLGPRSRLALRLCGDGLELVVAPGIKTGQAVDVIDCSG